MKLQTYSVNEIFDSIQGEGNIAQGRLATFIRLQGCTVGCPWCDSGPLADERELRTTNGLTKNTWGAGGVRMTAQEIATQVHNRHVIITGGEPTIYDLDNLIMEIQSLPGLHDIQLETSGQNNLKGESIPDIVTWSPKQNLNWSIPKELGAHVTEIKFVVDEHLTGDIVYGVLSNFEELFWGGKNALQTICFMPEGSPPSLESVQRTIQLMKDLNDHSMSSLFRFTDRLQYRIGVR